MPKACNLANKVSVETLLNAVLKPTKLETPMSLDLTGLVILSIKVIMAYSVECLPLITS